MPPKLDRNISAKRAIHAIFRNLSSAKCASAGDYTLEAKARRRVFAFNGTMRMWLNNQHLVSAFIRKL
tara:strand:- start:512 stop:715 length:204 start_codon:yes stop_codon:yes gene_type:complete